MKQTFRATTSSSHFFSDEDEEYEGLIEGRNVGDSALMSIYLHEIYLKL